MSYLLIVPSPIWDKVVEILLVSFIIVCIIAFAAGLAWLTVYGRKR